MPNNFPSKHSIEEEVHRIDNRTSVLETKFDYVDLALQENKLKLQKIDNAVDGISRHIALQNGTLPRLEAAIAHISERVSMDEQSTASITTKQKLTWGLLSGIFVSGVILIAKFLIGV